MKKVKIICNPSSGRQNAQKKIELLCSKLIDEGYIVGKFNTKAKNDAMHETIKTCFEDWDFIIASGGDGTINEIAKGIVKGKRKIPVAILSSGTVNRAARNRAAGPVRTGTRSPSGYRSRYRKLPAGARPECAGCSP